MAESEKYRILDVYTLIAVLIILCVMWIIKKDERRNLDDF